MGIQASLNQLTGTFWRGIAAFGTGVKALSKYNGKNLPQASQPKKEVKNVNVETTSGMGNIVKIGKNPQMTHFNSYLAAAKAIESANDAIQQKARSLNPVQTRLDEINSVVERNAKADYFRKIGAEVSDDGVVTLYHATPEENIEKIKKEGFKGSDAPINGGFDEGYKPRSFFGHNEDWVKDTWSSGGEKKIMKVKIPAEYLHQAGKNKNEVFVEGNIKNQGDLWIPDTKPTSSAWSRILIKEFKKGGSK